MQTKKLKTVEIIDKTYCDICNKVCTDDFYNDHEYALIEAHWGYFSRNDGTKYEIHLCENCFYDTISWMKTKRTEYFHSPIKDPLDGIS